MKNTKHNDAEARTAFRERMADVRAALADADKRNALMEDRLAIKTRIAVDIQLSTGGPGDGFEILCDAATGRPLRGRHYYTQWGYRKEVWLSPEELSSVCAAYGLDDARLLLDTD